MHSLHRTSIRTQPVDE
jgi:hypothetical protein